jgi:hypothetical protein
MRKIIVAVVAAGLLASAGGMLYSSDAFGATVTCSGTPGTLPGATINANITVPPGSWCQIAAQTVNGNVNVSAGAGLVLLGSTVNGNVNSPQAGSFAAGPICGLNPLSVVIGNNNQITGNITVNASAAGVVVGGGGCGGNTIKQAATVNQNTAAVFVVGNSVGTNLAVQSNTPGPVNVINNVVTGNITCTGNANVTSTGNTAGGHFIGSDCH